LSTGLGLGYNIIPHIRSQNSDQVNKCTYTIAFSHDSAPGLLLRSLINRWVLENSTATLEVKIPAKLIFFDPQEAWEEFTEEMESEDDFDAELWTKYINNIEADHVKTSTFMLGIQESVTKLTIESVGEYSDCTAVSTTAKSISTFIESFACLDDLRITGYHQTVRPAAIPDALLVSQLLSVISNKACALTSFEFSTMRESLRSDTSSHGINKVKKAIVNAVLKNKSLLSIKLDIRDNGNSILASKDNLLTAEDEATIQEHIENHRNTLCNGINGIAWQADDHKQEYMLPAACDIIFQYTMPQSE
jgi:hypothetical protein